MSSGLQQRPLSLIERSILPLADIGYARTRLRLREDAVLDAIEHGRLRYAFNIASPDSNRHEIRILTECIEAEHDGLPQPEYVDVTNVILPRPTLSGKFKTVRGVVLAERFVCSQWLIGNLIERKELQEAPIAIGAKASPFILHASAAAFLKRRLL